MELTDLLPLPHWLAIEKEINRRFNINASIFNTDGIRITDFKAWSNELCPQIKATEKGQSFICAVAHMNLANLAQHTGEPVVETCDAGLVKMVVPIFVGDQFIGAASACGALCEGGEVESYLIHKITEIDESKIQSLSEGIPCLSRLQIDAMAAYIRDRMANIVDQQTIRNGPLTRNRV